jgi:hypothetical protein
MLVKVEGDYSELSLEEVAVVDTGGDSFAAGIKDDVLFVSDMSYRGLKVINITDPTSPQFIDSYLEDDPHGVAHWFDIVDELLYFADFGDGLEIINISNPAHLTKITSWTDGFNVDSVVVKNDYAYTIGFEAGVRILNITDFESITKISEYKITDNSYASINLVDNYLYIGEINSTASVMKIIDITDPINPTLVNEIIEVSIIFGFQVIEDILYIGSAAEGILIYNVTNPAQPLLLNQYNSDIDLIGGLSVVDDYLFTVDFTQKKLKVINISNPYSPVLIKQKEGFVAPSDVVVKGNYLYVCDHAGGMHIIRIWTNPSTSSLNSSIIILLPVSCVIIVACSVIRVRKR